MLKELSSLIEMFLKESRAWFIAIFFYAIVFPLAIVFGFSFVVSKNFAIFLVSGTITFQVAITSLTSVAQSLGMDRDRGRLSFMISTGIPAWGYAIASSFVNNLMGIVSGYMILAVASFLGLITINYMEGFFLLVSLIIGTYTGSMFGLAMTAKIRNWRLLSQLALVFGFGFSFFAPVYFPLSYIPKYLIPLVYLEPTTYISQAIRLSMVANPSFILWNLYALLYGMVFMALASKWGLS
ncbi:MAG: ABC transporter permease [Caldisphaeraceae archaeon]|nr:ABC transporter permease [Caldisphaeraceae archaeon]